MQIASMSAGSTPCSPMVITRSCMIGVVKNEIPTPKAETVAGT